MKLVWSVLKSYVSIMVIILFVLLFTNQVNGQISCDALYKKYTKIDSLYRYYERKADEAFKKKTYPKIDSSLTNLIETYDQYCPCSYHHGYGQVVRLAAGIKFIDLDKKTEALKLYDEKIDACSQNDSIVLYLNGRKALIHLMYGDLPGMKKHIDKAIDLGAQKFSPNYSDYFKARINLGLYYWWKKDFGSAFNIFEENENLIANTVFPDTLTLIDNLEGCFDNAMELRNENLANQYRLKILDMVKGSRFENKIANGFNFKQLENSLENGDYVKAGMYFDKIDSSVYNSYFKALPMIRYLIHHGKHEIAFEKIKKVDSLLEKNRIEPNHLLRIQLELEKLSLGMSYYENAVDIANKIAEAIHSNYISLINQSPREQSTSISLISSKYTSLINRLNDMKIMDQMYAVYDNMNNIKNASSGYYAQINKFVSESSNQKLKDNFLKYKEWCSKTTNLSMIDSINKLANNIQNNIADAGIKWHSNIKVSMIQNQLSSQEVFLDFYQSNKQDDEDLFLFIVSKDTLSFVSYKNIVDTLSSHLLSANYVNNSKKNKALYNYLLRPIEPYLKNKKRIYLSLDGVLNQVALDILSPTGTKTKLFGDMFELLYVENSKSLFETHLHTDVKDNYIISGGIQYDCTTADEALVTSNKNYGLDGSNIQYLEGSKREVEMLESKLKHKNMKSKILTGCAASKDSILLGLEDPNVTNVHISTHGLINTEDNYKLDKYFINNSQSQLLLAKVNERDDAGLSAIEIINQNHTHKKLVFLSACNTGVGTYMAGFGNASVANAFKKAGARQVVATLWPIPDDVTVLLCDYFYDHFITHKDANAALKYAQNELRKQHYSPEKWAAFRVMN